MKPHDYTLIGHDRCLSAFEKGITMKRIAAFSLLAALTASGAAIAQSGKMKGMDMKSCMTMKGMDMNACQDIMNNQVHGLSKNGTVHRTSAIVKAVDSTQGTVTLAHQAVKSLNWPAMTMRFSVKDKALLDNLAVGKKVNVEFTQQGSDYVVTSVK
jgi:Cu(I)/Ag(I) efflux system protein CusF